VFDSFNQVCFIHSPRCVSFIHTGVFGNSASAYIKATWAIFGDNLTDTSSAGVITDRAVLETIDDFRYSRATDNRWHLAALTYDGRNSPLPALQYFIDGVEMVGNSQLENGSNSIINYT